MKLSDNAQRIYKLKYAKELPNNNVEEWPQTCVRVAHYISAAEANEDLRLQYTAEFTKIMLEQAFLPGGRILANAGTNIRNLMNCFVIPIYDSRESIYDALKKAAEIFAWGGGIGYNFSNLRSRGSDVKGTGGNASGPLSFMGLFDLTGEVISQASRRGAQMGILNIDHPDIQGFINYKNELDSRNSRLLEEYKRNLEMAGLDIDGKEYFDIMRKTLADSQLTHFNISVGITDEFMKNPNNELLRLIAENAWRNGDPGIFFIDRANEDNIVPYLGNIEATNPCLHSNTLMLDGDRLKRISDEGKTWMSWKSGNKETVRLTTNAGHEIILTPDHKIQLETGEFVEAKNSVGKSIKWALGNRESKTHLEEYELLGFLFGDGFITGDGFGIGVKLNPQKESYVADMLLDSGFHQQTSGAFYINKDEMDSSDFLKYRVWDRNIPEDILTGDSNKVASFLRGLFEANGSCNKVGQVSLKTTNKQLVLDVQTLLASFGIQSWAVTNKSTKIKWDNGVYISRESYNLQIAPRNGHKFLEKIGFLSDEKNSKIQIFDKEYSRKLRIDSIESFGYADVWDFSNERHYNLANGIVVHNCGEVPLLPYEPCCLGSINLERFVEGEYIDFAYMKDVIKLAIRFLDNVHTLNYTPVKEINNAAIKTRRLGLGVMGWADMLAEIGLDYDHEDAFILADIIAKTIQYTAWEASMELAEERGAFPAFDEEKINWNLIDKLELERRPLRNVAVTSIAPTGTIALIADVNSGIEPYFAHNYRRNITEGIGNSAKDTLEQSAVSNSIKTAHDIHWKDHIRMQAAWQRWTCNAVSKTINMPHGSTVDDVMEAYRMAWEMGLKGLTIYRDRSKIFQILEANGL